MLVSTRKVRRLGPDIGQTVAHRLDTFNGSPPKRVSWPRLRGGKLRILFAFPGAPLGEISGAGLCGVGSGLAVWGEEGVGGEAARRPSFEVRRVSD